MNFEAIEVTMFPKLSATACCAKARICPLSAAKSNGPALESSAVRSNGFRVKLCLLSFGLWLT